MSITPKITLKDLAAELKLSQATISRALRGDLAIKMTTRRKVAAVAGRLGYIKNKVKKSSYSVDNSAGMVNDSRLSYTIYDIAKLLNVSATTVSRALNDDVRVKTETKFNVLKTASLLNFNFNQSARLLSVKQCTDEPKITIYDLAIKLDLSPSTISRCLNGKPGFSADTIIAVKKAADEIGYTTDLNAAHLRTKRPDILQETL